MCSRRIRIGNYVFKGLKSSLAITLKIFGVMSENRKTILNNGHATVSNMDVNNLCTCDCGTLRHMGGKLSTISII